MADVTIERASDDEEEGDVAEGSSCINLAQSASFEEGGLSSLLRKLSMIA
jgi:hypothetical protein